MNFRFNFWTVFIICFFIWFIVSTNLSKAQDTVITTIGQITIIEKPGTPTVTCTTVSPTITICQ